MGSATCQEYQKKGKKGKIALDSLVRYGKLENGFTYYLRKNEIPANSVELHMVVKAGTYHEDEDQLGYSHLLEHMGFKGTKHFPDVKEYFQKSGRTAHAGTSYDHTFYYTKLHGDNKEEMENGLQLLRDWAQDIRFDQQSINVERGAVLGEIRTNEPYRQWLSDNINEWIIKETGFEEQNMEKYKLNIQNFNRDSFLRFYNNWYRPDLEAAIIVGDINVDSLELKIKKLFSDLKMPNNPKNSQKRVNFQKLELNQKNQFAAILDTVRSNLQLFIVRKFPNFSYNPQTESDYRSLILQELYWIMLAERQKQVEQQYNPPFSNLSLNYRRNQIGGGQILASRITVDFETDSLWHIKKRLVKALVGWKRMHIGFTGSELEKAKEQLLQNYYSKVPMSSSNLVKRYKDHFVNGTAAPHPKKEAKLVAEILQQVSLKQIQKFILKYGNINRYTDFLFFKGKNQSVPEFITVKKWISKVDTMEVLPLKPLPPPIVTLSGEVDLPATVEMCNVEVTEDLIGVSTVNMENGIKLVLKPTKPRYDFFVDKISFQAFRPNKIPLDNREEYLAAQVFPEVLQYSGAGPFTKFELERFMRDKEIKLGFRATKDLQIIFGESKLGSLDELLNLLLLYSTKPRIDAESLKAWKADKKERLKGFRVKGTSFFLKNEIMALRYPQLPTLKIEDLDDFTIEKVFNASKRWFSNFKDYTFIITGDFDTKGLIQQLACKLSVFPGKDGTFNGTSTSFQFPLKRMNEKIFLNNIDQPSVHLSFPFEAPRNMEDRIILKLLSKALNEKIWGRLRNGCYAPRAYGNWVDIKNGIYSLNISFDSELGNEKQMIRNALEEFRKLKKNGVEKEWLERAIANEVEDFESHFASFGYFNFWPGYLQTRLENGEDYVNYLLKYGTFLEHFVTLEDINAAAKKYFTEENLQQFIALPRWYHQVD